MALLHGQLLRDAEGHARREDRHLVDRVGVRQRVGQHRVATLVVGDPLLLPVGEDQRIAALAHHHAVSGRLEVLHGHRLAAPAHGVERRLVDQVGQVGAAHPGRPAGHQLEIDVGSEPLVLAVDLEDREPLLEIR